MSTNHRDRYGFIRIFRASGRIEYPYPEQIELGAAIHLALNQLQAIDLPLRLSITPKLRENGAYCSVIAPTQATLYARLERQQAKTDRIDARL